MSDIFDTIAEKFHYVEIDMGEVLRFRDIDATEWANFPQQTLVAYIQRIVTGSSDEVERLRLYQIVDAVRLRELPRPTQDLCIAIYYALFGTVADTVLATASVPQHGDFIGDLILKRQKYNVIRKKADDHRAARKTMSDEEVLARLKTTESTAYMLERSLLSVPAGRSWFGGAPLLPAHVAWPRTAVHGHPMSFLAQIDCSEARGVNELPRDGLLLFFCDLDLVGTSPAYRGTSRVIYVPEAEIPQAPTVGNVSVERQCDRCPMTLVPFAHVSPEATGLRYENSCRAWDLAEDVNAEARKGGLSSDISGMHMLLGPEQTFTHSTGGEGIRLLCLGPDPALECTFETCGIIEFWIDRDAFAEGRFEEAYAATAGR